MNNQPNKGFTLVELAVSLVVIGLLVGLGTAMVGPLMTAIKVRESKENLGAAVESVNSWASGNNRLPQWDDGTVDATNDEFVEVTRSTADAWGRPFIYLFDANLFNASPTKDTICGRRTAAITLTDSNTGATIQNVAYVILSQGDDAVTDSKIGVTAVTSQAITAATTVSANTTDDLVRWVTLDELRTKVGCQGAQLRIVNNELPFGAVPNAYSVKIYSDGGVPFATTPNTYKWCVNTLPAGFSAPTGGIQNANCLNANEATWGATPASSELTISFAASAAGLVSGSYQITVVARDNADNLTTSNECSNANPGDNCANKTFVLTINPQ
jgi:prepilin-type N-terminal cleavage/methylation domain-containing protein